MLEWMVGPLPTSTRSSVLWSTELWSQRLNLSFSISLSNSCLHCQHDVILTTLTRLTGSHTGVYLATQLHKILELYGIDEKASYCMLTNTSTITNVMQLLGVICDNAENNSTMMVELGHLLRHTNFPGQSARIRCFAHVLNLVVKVTAYYFFTKFLNILVPGNIEPIFTHLQSRNR
jgi:hypothetical protein